MIRNPRFAVLVGATSAGQEHAAMAKLASGGRIPSILVVEDDALLRLMVADFLRDAGYAVIEARSAAEAISTVEHAIDVDLVFSDVHMPGDADGLDLARWLQAHRPDVPVILTSGVYLSAEEGVIPKPYDIADVEALIRTRLRAR